MGQTERTFWQKHFTARKLIFYLAFHGLHWALFAVGWWKQQSDARLAGLNTLTYSVWFSRGAGLVLSVDTMIILLPMCRTILRYVRPKIRWLPLDESQWFHRQVAYQLLWWTMVHVASHYVNFINVEKAQLRPELALQIHYTQAGGITGHIMLLCMLLMYTTAHHRVRQQSYETFWYAHHLFIPFLLGMYTHATGCFVRDTTDPYSPFAGANFWNHCIGYEGWRWELVGGGLYLLERIYREIRARQATEIVKVVKHPYDAVEIQFRKPSMHYKPGQWLFLNCPSISYYQWHPFTITSCPVDPSGMYEVALQAGQTMPQIRIDGPYGAPAEDVFSNEIAVLIGTGIGVTPWASILKNIYHLRQGPNPPRRLRRVEFIWVCKDTASFEWFQALLSSLEAQSMGAAGDGQDDFLRIHTYLTQRLDVDAAQNIVLNSVGQAKDPLTELRSRTNFGRPDFPRLLTGLRDGIVEGSYMRDLGGRGLEATLRTEVGVYFCGPSVAARDIKRACQEADCREVKFKFWKEHF
ncbi:dual oxidase 1 precursor [Eremomyces bilateralis CBS 781.70]|uniref:Dual oxidase 1 n=1 Tax=Eremomyces bilateralis CBS 781.70 TaxID=1392243 RepID=A0A6G1G7G3_9PEZI|nr:dual oxidase 1 precursor [Eremomyces bilateralis CBS 781.70]KAF1813964.1 dual oxidase 1 precursor [Eremomyces bilateralis CBS 781.70]